MTRHRNKQKKKETNPKARSDSLESEHFRESDDIRDSQSNGMELLEKDSGNKKDEVREELSDGLETEKITEEDSIVDTSLDMVKGAWKLWKWVAVVAFIIGALSNIEAPDDEILLVEKAVALPKTRAGIFQYVGNLNNYNEWYPGIRAFDPTDATRMGIGKHFTEIIDVPLYGHLKYDNAVIGYESPRYLSFTSDSSWLLRTEIELTRRDSSKAPTLLTYRVHSRCRSYIFKYGTSHILGFVYGSRVRQALFNLRLSFFK